MSPPECCNFIDFALGIGSVDSSSSTAPRMVLEKPFLRLVGVKTQLYGSTSDAARMNRIVRMLCRRSIEPWLLVKLFAARNGSGEFKPVEDMSVTGDMRAGSHRRHGR